MKRSSICLLTLLAAALVLPAPRVLGIAGAIDGTFNPFPGANDTVLGCAVQADGKVIIVGRFTAVNGVARNRVARLNTDGSTDTTFNVGSGANGDVNAVGIQPNGQIVIAGAFTTINGLVELRISRLHSNGSVDQNFDPSTAFEQTGGADGEIEALAILPDGKILIGGSFNNYRKVPRGRVARLQNDGTLDTTFNPGQGANNSVLAIAAAADGGVVIGGNFELVAGLSREGVARLNANGTLDTSFVPGPTFSPGSVKAVAVSPDQRVLVGGSLFGDNQTAQRALVRLNPNGSRDASFNAVLGRNDQIDTIVLQSTGKILVGGYSNSDPNTTAPRTHMWRFNSDGTHDPNFDLEGNGPNARVYAIAIAPDTRILIGGMFTSVGGNMLGRVARLVGVNPPTLLNISTRSVVQTGDRVAIAGFIITGNGGKQLLLRGIGPSLSAQGVSGALQDPVIELYNSSGALITSNDDWKSTQQSEIAATGLAPTDSREAALLINLGPGTYTVKHRGYNNYMGVGLVEVYDLTGGSGAKLANISTRAFVGTGANVTIGGFIVGGDDARVVVRAIGPSLAAAGVAGALANPRVALYDGNGNLVGFNHDWRDGQEAEIVETGLQPTHNLEAALIVTLQSGNYTAVMEGFDQSMGIGLVEVYHVQ